VPPKPYSPGGGAALPGPAVGDEVTDIEANSSPQGAIPPGTEPIGTVRTEPPSADGESAQARNGSRPAADAESEARAVIAVAPTGEPGAAAGGPGPRRSRYRTVRDVIIVTYRRGVEIELMHRAFGFAALGFVTLVPLLIVVAAAAPINGRTFPEWAVAGLGLSGRAATSVNHLFGPTNRVLSTTTALGLAVLAVFGLSFVSVVETGLARVWELPSARLLSVWRRVVWLAALVGFLLVGSDLLAQLYSNWFIDALRWCATTVGSMFFFWWTARFLLEGRVPWRALLPGAAFTVVGLVGLRLFSALIFSPLIVSSAITYGAIGAVLILVSWLIGTGFVIFGGALLGRVVYEAWGGGSA
jgi:membrane protein